MFPGGEIDVVGKKVNAAIHEARIHAPYMATPRRGAFQSGWGGDDFGSLTTIYLPYRPEAAALLIIGPRPMARAKYK